MPRHFGIVCPPVPGHLHPLGALGRELVERGHRVTVFHMADLGERVRREQLEFVALGDASHPPGTLPEFHRQITQLSGWSAMRFTIDAVVRSTKMFLEQLPEAVERVSVDALLVDQMEPAGACVAHLKKLPFVTVCNALALNREPGVPPPFTPWSYSNGWLAKLRNRLGYRINDFVLRRVMLPVAEFRKGAGLPALHAPEDFWSPMLQICQMPPAFDFPRLAVPNTFRYTGPLRRPLPVEGFPWHRLNAEKKLVYASLGTLQNGKEDVFAKFAEACEPLNVQLLVTHGGALGRDAAFVGDTVVVPYAPQLDVLARAAATLTHAGLNTALDSLSCGVPLVAVPITYEQPAIASRIQYCGAGLVTSLKELSAAGLHKQLKQVLTDLSFVRNARRVQESVRQAGGVRAAADLTLEAV